MSFTGTSQLESYQYPTVAPYGNRPTRSFRDTRCRLPYCELLRESRNSGENRDDPESYEYEDVSIFCYVPRHSRRRSNENP
jgi:hypothetical protein